MPNMWDIKHDYYCNQGNYYARGDEQPSSIHRSFSDFLDAEGDSDMDMNLLFRWDWKEEDDDGKSNFTGDVYYCNGKLLLFYMGQRKGLYRWVEVDVCRADEPAVVEFLKPRWEHLKSLWMPISS